MVEEGREEMDRTGVCERERPGLNERKVYHMGGLGELHHE